MVPGEHPRSFCGKIVALRDGNGGGGLSRLMLVGGLERRTGQWRTDRVYKLNSVGL